MRERFGKAFVAGVGAVFALVLCGVALDNLQSDPPKPETIVKTKIVYKTKVVEKPVISEACETALDSAMIIAKSAKDVGDVSNKQIDILSDGRVALGIKDQAALTKATQDQLTLSNDTTESLGILVDQTTMYESALKGCKQSIE